MTPILKAGGVAKIMATAQRGQTSSPEAVNACDPQPSHEPV